MQAGVQCGSLPPLNSSSNNHKGSKGLCAPSRRRRRGRSRLQRCPSSPPRQTPSQDQAAALAVPFRGQTALLPSVSALRWRPLAPPPPTMAMGAQGQGLAPRPLSRASRGASRSNCSGSRREQRRPESVLDRLCTACINQPYAHACGQGMAKHSCQSCTVKLVACD